MCSDSMSRGMDVPSVQAVVNYDAPAHFKSYLHRVGRTARAGAKGNAYTILTRDEVLYYYFTQTILTCSNFRWHILMWLCESMVHKGIK